MSQVTTTEPSPSESDLIGGSAKSGGVLRRFRIGVAWNLLAMTANQGSTFAANMAIAAIIGQVSFGRYGVVLSTIQLLSAFAGMSIGYAATRYIAEFRDSDRLRAGRIYGCGSVGTFVLSTVMAGLLLALAGPIADHVLNSPPLAPLLRIAAVTVFFTTMNGFRSGVVGGLEGYRTLGVVGAVSGLLYFVVCVGMAMRWGVNGAVVGLLLSASAQWVLLGRAVSHALRQHQIKPRYEYGGAEAAIVRRFVVPGAISGLTGAPALWIAQAVLARRAGGFGEMALYTAAYNLTVIVLFLPNVANTVGMTLLNHLLGREDGETYERVFWMNLLTSVAIALLGVAAVLGLSPWLLAAYGSAFHAATPVLAILLLATVPEALTIALNQLLQSKQRMWTAIFWVNIPRDSLIVIAAIVLVPRLGARGLALAYLLGRIVALVAIVTAIYRMGGPRIGIAAQPSEVPA